MNDQQLIPHLFRTEFWKIAAVLCKLFGLEHMEVAEDVAGETFLLALETWTYKGIPENPVAWLYAVAKNKARNLIARDQVFRDKVALRLKTGPLETRQPEVDLSDQNIQDSQLQMLFAVCHPSIPIEAQIGLALRILCGFGIEEIASAFLTNKETINKRLFRAREKLRLENVSVELPSPAETGRRLDTVLKTIYLLFNEGYYSESTDTVLREDLCLEAMRLNYLLVENPLTSQPAAYALLSLMCFHVSRFPARKDENGEIILYQDQDESLWDQDLIAKGALYLKQASEGKRLTTYHLEAQIAYWHTVKADTKEKWENILQIYNLLLQISYTPVAALNRTFALSKVKGKEIALLEAEKLALTENPYYHILLGELYTGMDNRKARSHLEKAVPLIKNKSEKKKIQIKMDAL
jgi:RNA polymerase sigma-70 factor (ECF subfamily)